ncbi:ATP-binding protein PRP16 [Fusarium circinatum]|uniref:ATP-binding protein PRP16 n=1 Tax=Fusarium circinatum TaxID=48490 RepID=A0A8H5XCQ4_FUSCI|nr:ATP-binding protein PRP16 [Fusarium circinatum]
MMKDTKVKLTNTTGSPWQPLIYDRKPQRKNKQITAAQAIAIEDPKDHPFRPGEKLSEKYFELFKQRRALPVSPRRQEFLDAYHQHQPRRIAATSVAARTATELDIQVGDEVGNLVRLDRKAHPWKTRLGYMTDGILTELAKTDPDFNLYAAVMPATLNAEKFVCYFGSEKTTHFTLSIFSMALMIRKDIHDKKRDGDILIFFQSVGEVEEVCNLLRKEIDELLDLSLYSKLPRNQEGLILQTRTQLKCVCATNIAEVRITIDGIVYVIGQTSASPSNLIVTRAWDWSPFLGVPSLKLPLVSAQGRIKPGFCYRLYTHKSFMEDMRPSNQLEILESDTASHVLRLKVMGFDDVARFDFIDRPHPEILF